MTYYFIGEEKLPDWPFSETKEAAFIGGEFSVEYLADAYSKGYFPWFKHEGHPVWFNPNPRCVLIPEHIKVSKSMRPYFNQGKFTITTNRNFKEVIEHCSAVERKGQESSWIDGDFIAAYNQLHLKGYAHSYEVWQHGDLVGGLYFLQFGKMICGESMFSLVSNASKFAFIHLAQNAQKMNVPLIDCQVTNPHLLSLGATEINRTVFLNHIEQLANE